MKTKDRKAMPSVVPLAQWQDAHDQLLRKEKAATLITSITWAKSGWRWGAESPKLAADTAGGPYI
jgi:hypothetical protein